MIVDVCISTGIVGADRQFEVEIPDEDLEGLDEQERDQFIHSWVSDEVNNYVSWGWTERGT